MPIHEEICTTKYEFCQFSTNLVILCQSWTNSQILCQSSANPMRICQSTNHWPIQGKSHRQDIGTHWHRSCQSHRPIRKTIPWRNGEQVYYGDRPKCLDGAWFRQSISDQTPLHPTIPNEFTNPLAIRHQSVNQMPMREEHLHSEIWILPIWCQFMTNPWTTRQSFTNAANPSPIHQSNANPGLISQSITTNLPIETGDQLVSNLGTRLL